MRKKEGEIVRLNKRKKLHAQMSLLYIYGRENGKQVNKHIYFCCD